MEGEIVPFGKHKGEPVEVMLADPGYKDWLLAQPWVRDRYPTFHQTIINYSSGAAVETPEHNEMQARFLDDAYCIATAKTVLNKSFFDGGLAAGQAERKLPQPVVPLLNRGIRSEIYPARVFGRQFEMEGWDVRFKVEGAMMLFEIDTPPECICSCDHSQCDEDAVCKDEDGGGYCPHRIHVRENGERWQHCVKECIWRDGETARWLSGDPEDRSYQPNDVTLHIECKPDLGDDFPAVLRQVKSHGGVGVWVVVVRRADFTSVSFEQVYKMFGESRIHLVAENRIVVDG